MNILLCALVIVQDPQVTIEQIEGKRFGSIRATTPTYQILTDADEETARVAAGILERHHRGFVTVFKEQLRGTKTPLKVRLYATARSFRRALPMGAGAGGFYNPRARTLHVTVEQPRDDDWKWVLRHEGTHQLLHLRLGIGDRMMGSSSIWFNEGFASYWASSHWNDDKLVTGDINEMLLGELQRLQKRKRLLSLKKLVEARPSFSRMKVYYAQGWALCHFLWNAGYRDRFDAFLEREREGRVTYKAFLRVFEVEDAEAFERAFLAYTGALGTY